MPKIKDSQLNWQLTRNGSWIAILPDRTKINCGTRRLSTVIEYDELEPDDRLGEHKEFHSFVGYAPEGMPKMPETATFSY